MPCNARKSIYFSFEVGWRWMCRPAVKYKPDVSGGRKKEEIVKAQKERVVGRRRLVVRRRTAAKKETSADQEK